MKGRIVLAVTAIVALTIIPALIEGQYVNRWSIPPDLEGAAEQVGNFPRNFGAWTFSKEGDPLSEDVCRELGVAGYLTRTYTNRDSGVPVQILLMVGKSGPLLRHPPNICYANMANEQIGNMTKLHATNTQPANEFNLLEYKRARTVTNDRFLVAYGMAIEATWKVPDMPRIEFGAAPMLYKVQLLVTLDPSQSREAGAAILQKFAEDFCVSFEKHLQKNSGQTDEKRAT